MSKAADTDKAAFARTRFLEYRHLSRNALLKLVTDAGYGQEARGIASKAALTHLMQRVDRCLPCYLLSTERELERFCSARNLDVEIDGRARSESHKQYQMRQALFAADEQPEFHRFFELPAEVRNVIYELSMVHYPKTLKTPSQPPITMTRKAVRQEVLSVFYSRHTFELNFARHEPSVRKPWTDKARRERQAVFRETLETFAFLSAIPLSCHTQIQKLKLTFAVHQLYKGEGTMSCEFDLGRAGHEVQVYGNHQYHDLLKLVKGKVKVALEAVVEGMGARKGGKRLMRLMDLQELRAAFQEAYNRAMVEER
ncbi:hypothetical protein B0A55_10870 [Friedmanniomyces simplex]|uniref:Uncharacterized protein n=1 Tax=Friedmanniomyces simplex TaxID=329884 RepID=A0A4U0WX19_9PEZI|nr:hypothetical protein B0A55_10870 [Friedmanniomyces simplex]